MTHSRSKRKKKRRRVEITERRTRQKTAPETRASAGEEGPRGKHAVPQVPKMRGMPDETSGALPGRTPRPGLLRAEGGLTGKRRGVQNIHC